MLKKRHGAQFRIDLKEILIELLEACIHHILASRSIYPQSVFTKRLFGPVQCGVPIMVSVHPDINTFITEGLAGFRDAIFNPISSHVIDQFDLVILENTNNGEEHIIETYIFQFEFFQPNGNADDNIFLKEKDRFEMEQNIRALVLCLTSKMAEIGLVKLKTKETIEPDYSFNFRLHTSRHGAKVLADDLRWCKVPSYPDISRHSSHSSPSILDTNNENHAFSICDMVKKRSQQLVESKETKKTASSKMELDKDEQKINANVQKILMEGTEQDRKLSCIDAIKSSDVFVPVYQFDLPFKLKLLIEHSED